MPSIHFNIPKVKVLLKESYLYDLDPVKEGYVEAEIIAISSYPEHVPTFTALVKGKYLFHYLPIVAFVDKPSQHIDFAKAYSFNCPSTEVSVSVFNLKECQVFDQNKELIGFGIYQMTFDWYLDNALCHMIKLNNGNYILAPSHKVIFTQNSGETLPNYKKLHSTWKL
jgi:hypothetical protein